MKQNFKILSYIIAYAVYMFWMIIQFCFNASNYIFCRDSINFVASSRLLVSLHEIIYQFFIVRCHLFCLFFTLFVFYL